MKNKLVIVGTGQWSQDLKAFVDRYEMFDIVGYAVEKQYYQNAVLGGGTDLSVRRIGTTGG